MTRILRQLFVLALCIGLIFPQGILLAAVTPGNASARPDNIADQISKGLIAYWTLDGKQTNWSTGQTQDISGSANTGQLVGMSTTTSPVTGKIGQAFKLNGSTQYVSVGPGTVSSLTNNFTISAWVKPNSLSGIRRIVGVSNVSSVNGFGFGTNGEKLRFTTNGVLDYDTSSTNDIKLATSTWVHVAVVFDSANDATFYINGTAVETVAGASPATANADDPIYIGGARTGGGTLNELWNGVIDDVRIYNYTLSYKDITQIYAAGSATILKSKRIFLTNTSQTQWTVPADWNSSNNTIEVIGGGAGGNGGAVGSVYGGGGGAYSKIANLTLTPGASVTYRIGSGGASGNPSTAGGDTFFNRTAGSANTCADTSSVCAKGGSGSSSGTGGDAASGIGTVKYSGGNGGLNSTNAGGGGGGAAGPRGNGGNGGSSTSSGGPGGGGGGGGSNAADNTLTTGTNGGNNYVGYGAGIRGSPGTNGFGGGGGGGGDSHADGGDGGNGTEWGSSYGSGGGGGAAGHDFSGAFPSGGLYGGGGAGKGNDANGSGGAGAQGLVVITYVPKSPNSNVTNKTTIGVSNTTLGSSNSLVGYWPFDGKYVNWATGLVSDASGQGKDAQMTGMSTSSSPVAGKTGQALKYNADTSYVITPFVLNPATTNFSAFAWVKVATVPPAGDYRILGQNDDVGTGRVWLRASTAGKLVSTLGNVTLTSNATPFLVANKWHHVGVVVRGGVRTFYIDGSVDASDSITLESAAGKMHIGTGTTFTNVWDGVIDDVRIYNKALTYQEIQALYNATK